MVSSTRRWWLSIEFPPNSKPLTHSFSSMSENFAEKIHNHDELGRKIKISLTKIFRSKIFTFRPPVYHLKICWCSTPSNPHPPSLTKPFGYRISYRKKIPINFAKGSFYVEFYNHTFVLLPLPFIYELVCNKGCIKSLMTLYEGSFYFYFFLIRWWFEEESFWAFLIKVSR